MLGGLLCRCCAGADTLLGLHALHTPLAGHDLRMCFMACDMGASPTVLATALGLSCQGHVGGLTQLRSTLYYWC